MEEIAGDASSGSKIQQPWRVDSSTDRQWTVWNIHQRLYHETVAKRSKGSSVIYCKKNTYKDLIQRFYFDDKYQGVPIGGYTQLINKLIDGIEVKTGVDYFETKNPMMPRWSASFIPVELMNIIITNLESWNTDL